MISRWDVTHAEKLSTDLELRAYSSRLIGQDTAMVLHGGGNTSVKSSHRNIFGEDEQVVWVKASGFDLGTMGTEGFTGLMLEPVVRLANLDKLSDADMVNEVKRARINTDAAAASVEAILHALLPFKYVDHTHADAVLTISNSINADKAFAQIYGDSVLVLPFVKPGFDLALQFREVLKTHRLDQYQAVILEHHGVFTYNDDARTSYEAMIDVVDKAERYLLDSYGAPESGEPGKLPPLVVAKVRKEVSRVAGQAVLSLPVSAFPAQLYNEIATLSRRGTLTPEHVIHNKPFPAKFGDQTTDTAAGAVDQFASEYTDYFNRANDPALQMLSPYPHWGIFTGGQVRSFGVNLKRSEIARDVGEANLRALQIAHRIGGWQGLREFELRDLEYWELEQAKIKKQKAGPALTGKIAVVSGAATGIGRACAEVLAEKGAVVVGLDINPAIKNSMDRHGYEGIELDLTNESDVVAALAEVVQKYGGIDILVSNAGIFTTGATIENMLDSDWDSTLTVNLTSHRKLIGHAIPYLRHGINPSVVFICSRNVTAPGAGASAYSVSKAGLTQLMRVAALELAHEGITVNAIHPDAVFDTALWTEEALRKSADRYGITVEAYKTKNLLKTEIRSRDVGLAVAAFADGTLSKTTGAQLPVDGGNDRVI